jgi:hypothetical protein
MAKQGPALTEDQSIAAQALQQLGINKTQAEELVLQVPGNTYQEIAQNAFAHRQRIKEGTARNVPLTPTGAAPASQPEASPAYGPYRQIRPFDWERTGPIQGMAKGVGGVIRGLGKLGGSLVRGIQPQYPPFAPIRSGQQPSAPPPQAQAPPPQQPTQGIPGFAPPGGPSAAAQPEQLQQQAQALAAQSIARTQAALGPQGVAAAEAAPTAIPPAPIKPRIRVRATPGAAEPAELPLIATQQEYDKLPIGSRFRHPDGFIYRKVAEIGAQEEPKKMQEGGLVEEPEEPQEKTIGDTDTVPAQLTPGEYVMPKEAVQQVGKPILDALAARAQAQQQQPQQEQPGVAPRGESGKAAPFEGGVRTMSFGPPEDKPTHAVLYGALRDSGGKQVRLGLSDIAVSPNLLAKHGLRLGDYVDVLNRDGSVMYPHQRIADLSYISEGRPTTNSIELWGRPEPKGGYSMIRPAVA